MNIIKKAQKYSDLFESHKRIDGTTFVIIPLKNDKNYNEKLYNAIYEAHGDRLPDDWVYGTFADLLMKVTNYDIKEIEDLEDVRNEIVDSYVDTYTSSLTSWLNSDNRNVYYLTEVLEELEPKDGFQLLAMAQYRAIDEVMQSVINLLSK